MRILPKQMLQKGLNCFQNCLPHIQRRKQYSEVNEIALCPNNCIVLDKLLGIPYLELLKKFPLNPIVFLCLTSNLLGLLSPGSSITVS